MIGAGTSTYTVQSIIDRLFVTYLTPPDAQYAQARLGAAVSSTTESSILFSGFTIPEDEALMRQGSILEFRQELMRVVSYDSESLVATVTRGEYGTIPSTHTTPLLVNLNPPFTRAGVFEAVADNILMLYPTLFTVRNVSLSPAGYRVYAIPDELAVEIREVTALDAMDDVDLHARIVDFHEETGGRSLITNRYSGDVWLRYTRRMGKATSESDALEDLGMDDRWTNIVMAGAAADLLVGRSIPATQTEWIKSVLEAENVRVGTRMSIAGGLRQYRNLLLDDAKKEMRAEYKPRATMRRADRALT